MNTLVKQAATATSRILHPLLVMTASSVLVSIQINNSIQIGLINAAIFLLCQVPAISYILMSKYRRKNQSYHKKAIILSTIGFITSIAVFYLIGAKYAAICGLIIALIVGIGLTAINRVWDMSFHASIPMSCAAFFLPFSHTLMIIFAVAGIAAGLARIPIRHHSALQVITGWLYGFGTTAILVLLLIGEKA